MLTLSGLTNLSIEALLTRPEDEGFDRTRLDSTKDGQDSLGLTIAGLGTKNGGLILVGQEDLKKGGMVCNIAEEEFHKVFGD